MLIKDLIRRGYKLLHIRESFPKIHKIDELWKICESVLQRISPGDSVEELNQIKRLIDEFCKADPLSIAFRYPEDKEGNPSLRNISHINIRNIKEVIEKIATILEGAGAMIDEYLSVRMIR